MKHHSETCGFWHPHTATLDWCEENYIYSHYIAEFHNTTTSLLFPLMAAYAGYYTWKHSRVGSRYLLAYVILGIVGIGSALFHGTLRYEMQLADELPMIYGAAQQLFCLLPTRLNAIFIFLLCTSFTVYYIFVDRNPWIHELLFGGIEIAFALVYLCKALSIQRKRDSLKLLGTGVFFTLLASAMWIIDNNFCPQLRAIRIALGPVLGDVFEMHAWWHAISGLGVLWLLSGCIVLSHECSGIPMEYNLHFHCIPVVHRIQAKHADKRD